jgi:PAS domain S-box-containing protein
VTNRGHSSRTPYVPRTRGVHLEFRSCASAARGADSKSLSELEAIGGEIEDAIERVRVPAYVIDSHGIIRYLNPAARKLVGDVRGRQLTSVVAPEETRRAREIFARNLMGPRAGSDNKGVVIGADGERVSIEVSAVPLQSGGRVIGVFGQVLDVEEDDPPPPPHPHLTPRQTEVLRLLEQGRSTEQMARELQLSTETVRNHIRHILRALNVHSRLEAVAVGRQEHLVAN